MRIVIDFQGGQTTGSRTRGIGRYSTSLVQAMLRNRDKHQIYLVLNGLFADTIEPIRKAFEELLPQEYIRVWKAPAPVSHLAAPRVRWEVAQLVRESFLAELEPDVILITSLFEGLEDDAVTSVGQLIPDVPTAAILFDLIPYVNKELYLQDPDIEAWYLGKIEYLRRTDLLLAISESSRQEAIRYLGVDQTATVNISTAADSHFVPRTISSSRESELREKYGLDGPFVMCTSGIDLRKNIDGLIRGYAILAERIRRQHQLVIVCSLSESDRKHLVDLAKTAQLSDRELVLTGFVSENDLVDLYNLCSIFVFPSWHEGFGLPVLEAMSCGAPVVGANKSSIPEVIGREDALFDPHDENDIAEKLFCALTDDHFRNSLAQHGIKQAKLFSWDRTAKLALFALEELHRRKMPAQASVKNARPKLAYLSPLPPERSGISNYSAELLPELGRYYDIDLVVSQYSPVNTPFPVRSVDWFFENAQRYDRILYHFGNSVFHEHMFSLLHRIPGVVVLHDFFLSGILQSMDARTSHPGGFFQELYHSHGVGAVKEFYSTKNIEDILWRYPCNLSVLEQAEGIIVHSETSRRLIDQWYWGAKCEVIPLLRKPARPKNRSETRKALGFTEQQFIVASFGFTNSIKLNRETFLAWKASRLAEDKQCVLFFVGENDPGPYGLELQSLIESAGLADRVRITGWADNSTFERYLASVDIAVQLRTNSRGETSAAVLDCMNYGLATIVNANGSMADLDDDSVFKLADNFKLSELTEALERLWGAADLRKRLGDHARAVIRERHEPGSCALRYYNAIEQFNLPHGRGLRALSKAIAKVTCAFDDEFLAEISSSLATNMLGGRKLFVDVSDLVQARENRDQQELLNVFRDCLIGAQPAVRIEPVYRSEDGIYRYARRFALALFNCPTDKIDDEPLELCHGDTFIALELSALDFVSRKSFHNELRGRGVQVQSIGGQPKTLADAIKVASMT